MAAGDINVTVVGNLTNDPELRFTANGAAVASFTVASSSRYLDKATNEWKDSEPVFLRCNVWRQYAENVAESLTKGTRVIVTGRLKAPSAYQTAQGEARASLELEIEEIGPSLRYATAAVARKAREGGSGAVAGDPWGDAPAVSRGAAKPADDAWANPGTAGSTAAGADDTPF